MPRHLLRAAWLVVACLLALSPARGAAAAADPQDKAMALIDETADRICTAYASRGSADDARASDEIRARLDRLVRSLATVQAPAAGAYEVSRYEGGVREDVAKALKDDTDCRLRVFLTLQDKLLPAASPSAAPPPAARPAPSPSLAALASGRWTTRSLAECDRRWYAWSVQGDEMVFADQSKQVDVERILERDPDGFVTMTEASEHGAGAGEPPGTRWRYRFVSNDSVLVQRLPSGASFTLTRC